MAATTTLALSVGSLAYNAYQSSKKPATPVLPAVALPDPAIAASQASTAMAQSEIAKKRRASEGRSSTLLTGPQGVPAAPLSNRTLLG